jgi:hypothetical protein
LLPPDARSVLTDALRPPPGAELDRAVALTSTLDLESALVVPLAFAARAVRETNDPLTVMDAVRRCADRVDIFCQAGQITVPTVGSDLHAFLETMVHPVRRPRPGRLFHPKLWALRFWDEANQTYLARLLVLSRNLTADRSWDACLRLDGYVTTTRQARNKPIADLIGHTLNLAIDLPHERRVALEQLAEDMRRVEWELPNEAETIAFHAIGTRSGTQPDFSGGSRLIVSPFCNEAGLGLVAPSAQDVVLVGRQEELDRMPEKTLNEFDVHVVNELAGLPPDDADQSQGIISGLHAKLYVIDEGWNARLIIGSANATDAAFGGNTELLVELSGKRKWLGVDTMIAPEAEFRRILEPYNRQPAVDRDDDQWQLENYLRDVATTPLVATVVPHDDLHAIDLTSMAALPSRSGVRLTAELLTRRGEAAGLMPGSGVAATFVGLHVADVTPFVVLKVSDASNRSASTIVRARLVGDPTGRLDEILARQVDTPEKFLQFMALLLGLGAAFILSPAAGPGPGVGAWTGAGNPGVLELLMRGLVDQPRQLDDLASLVARLTSTEPGCALLPEGFADLWKVIDEVRLELASQVTP